MGIILWCILCAEWVCSFMLFRLLVRRKDKYLKEKRYAKYKDFNDKYAQFLNSNIVFWEMHENTEEN